jgi:hypothetical protein
VSQDLVVARTFLDEVSAELARTVLEANGVPALVLSDTAGGALPAMAMVFPVRLLVLREDEQFARELLDTAADGLVESDEPDG